MSELVLELKSVTRVFHQGEENLEVLKGADLSLGAGETAALIGPSGAGKSTLLHIAGLLEQADSGEVIIAGQAAGGLKDDERTGLRRDSLGFVYQYHHLLPEFSALENIIVPQMIAGRKRAKAKERAAELLELMGLTPRASHRPGRLSGGEQQRVAIARALANEPKLLLADEPTGNLDPNTANQVFDLLLNLVRGAGLTALIATHNESLAARMDRKFILGDGKLQEA